MERFFLFVSVPVAVGLLVFLWLKYRKPAISIEETLSSMTGVLTVKRSSKEKGVIAATLLGPNAKYKILYCKKSRTITVFVRGMRGNCKMWLADYVVLARCSTLWWTSGRLALDQHEATVVKDFMQKALGEVQRQTKTAA